MSCAKEASACVSISSIVERGTPKLSPSRTALATKLAAISTACPSRASASCAYRHHPSARRRQYGEDDHCSGDALVDASSPAGGDQFALPKIVEGYAEQAGDQLQLGVVLAVAFRPEIGRDGLGLLFAQLSIGIDGVLQRRREALHSWVRSVRFTLDDEGEDPISPAEPLNSRIS